MTQRAFSFLSLSVGSLLAAMLPLPVFAQLPTMEDPSRGAGSGIMETLQNYGCDIVMLIALLDASWSYMRAT